MGDIKTNYTVSIDGEVISKIRELSKRRFKGYISKYLENCLKDLIKKEGGEE